MNLGSIIKSLFISAAAISSAAIPASALNEFGDMTAEDINDLALIWIGSHSRSEWDKEMFTPYVAHTFQDGHKTWFFDGFVMLEGAIEDIVDGEVEQTYSLGEAPTYPARKDHWEYILDKQLGLIDGTGCKALDEAIEEQFKYLGKPATKHKVVMMQCIPVGGAANWGQINGKTISFATNEGKIEAMKWYTDLVIKRFNECNFRNIVLDGIYWLREAITDAEIPLIKGMTPYYKSKGLKSYWIPWLRGFGYQRWKEFGIDVTYEQPGYFFTTDRPYERLEQACEDAWEYDFGIELEFEGCGVTGIDDKRVVAPQFNAAMYENSPVYHQRFIDYIDILEETLIFDAKQMAYYNGYQGIYDFAQSKHPKDKQLMDRLATILENRHVASGWYDADNAGLVDIDINDKVIINSYNGVISVKATTAVPVTVYSLDGLTVYNSGKAISDNYSINCNKGIYIVKVDNHVEKIVVR